MSLDIFKHKTITGIHIIGMLIMFAVIIVFASIVAYKEYANFDNEAKGMQISFIQKQKDTIAFDTTRVLDFISDAYKHKNMQQNEDELKKQILHAIEQLYGRQDGTGYIFIYDFNGVVLSDPVQRQNIGKNLYDTKDTNGVMVIKDLIDISQKKEGGFVEYQWLKPTTSTLSPKVSYAKSFEPWGWMVGTGVYLDEVEKHIGEQRNTLKDKLNLYSLKMALLLGILFVLGIIGVMLINRILKKEIATFSHYFEEASSSYVMMDKDNIRLYEFKKLVHYINAMISVIRQRKQKLKEMNLTLESKVEEKTKYLSIQNDLLEKEKVFSDSLVKAQDSFIKHSIHEINTPLAVIMTHIDIHKMKFGEDKYLSQIEAASKMIANIYDDLSYMVKKDRFVYEKQWISFSLFLEGRIDFFKEIAKGNKHKIISEIEQGITIYFSEIELQRIVDNNLSNAIKYANKNTEITVKVSKENEKIILEFLTYSKQITDTKRIFEPFHQEEDMHGGFGLGLEIVRSICRKEDVAVEVNSDTEITIFKYKFWQGDVDENFVA